MLTSFDTIFTDLPAVVWIEEEFENTFNFGSSPIYFCRKPRRGAWYLPIVISAKEFHLLCS
jgi:hypothetical protein